MISLTGPFPHPYLLAVSEKRIAVIDLISNYSSSVIDECHNITNLVIDPVDNKIYFQNGTKVHRANFDGSDKEVIDQNDGCPTRIFALDWIGRHMFWVEPRMNNMILFGTINLTNGIELHSSEENISSLAVDPNEG